MPRTFPGAREIVVEFPESHTAGLEPQYARFVELEELDPQPPRQTRGR